MENEYIVTPEGDLVSKVELYHWGIKGMKWGVRRYQNKDGSLTKAGMKRYAKLEAEMKQLKPKRKTKAEKSAEVEESARKKLVSEMSDDELKARTNRMRIEKDYYDAAHNLAIANPQKVSAGKKFMDSLVKDVVAPAAKNAGREWAEKFMKDKLGLNKKDFDPIAKLEKDAKKLKAEKEIEEYKAEIKKLKSKKKGNDDLPEVKTWDDVEKRRKYLETINGTSTTNQNNNSNNNNSNNNSNNSDNNSNNTSGNQQNNSNNKPQQQTSQNTNKTNQQKPVNQSTKVNDVEYYSKEYEKHVDKLLAEIDDNGWELYNKYYR